MIKKNISEEKSSPKQPAHGSKQTYMKPVLTALGTVAELTLGQNGSNIDGRCTRTKKGFGNGTPKHCEDRGQPLY